MKWYVLVIFLVIGLSVVGLFVISFNLDPYKSSVHIKYLFFTSLFMAIWGFSASALNRFKLRIDWPDFYESFKTGFIVSMAILAVYVFISQIIK